MLATQLTLKLQLQDDATLENFFVPLDTKNALLINQLTHLFAANTEQFIYLWGAASSGKTHLLQAACHFAHKQGFVSQYLPLDEVIDLPANDTTAGLESLDLVCLDNLEVVIDRPDWQIAIFNLFNRIRECNYNNKECNKRLLVSANASPKELNISLKDLESRLQSGLVHHLLPLNDNDKVGALQQRAQARGLHLPTEVAVYLVQHLPRDAKALFSVLDQLDKASLAEQRKLTIPFIKKILLL
jgi:DnaA-homolog protein